jgi:uncharacterized C2H2 Zn-finger protein
MSESVDLILKDIKDYVDDINKHQLAITKDREAIKTLKKQLGTAITEAVGRQRTNA